MVYITAIIISVISVQFAIFCSVGFENPVVVFIVNKYSFKIRKANVMGTESIVEIISLEKGADAKLFEIPEDYQMIAY